METPHPLRGLPSTATPISGFEWETPVDLSDRRTQERLSPKAVKAFFGIVDLWKLKDDDARLLLGGISSGSYYQLKKEPKLLDQDRLTRVSFLVGIFKALNILYSAELADAWIQLPNTNPVFGGATPLAYIVRFGLPGMERVRQLLDARRGGR